MRSKQIKRDDWGHLMICRSYGECRSIPGEHGYGPTITGQYSKQVSRGQIEESREVHGPIHLIKKLHSNCLIKNIGVNKWLVTERS
jgi:hypothetical protein